MIDKILSKKEKYDSKITNPFIWYIEQINNQTIDEMDTFSSNVSSTAPLGPIGFKSEFDEGLTDKIYEALKKK